jgi:hypothetical protein
MLHCRHVLLAIGGIKVELVLFVHFRDYAVCSSATKGLIHGAKAQAELAR